MAQVFAADAGYVAEQQGDRERAGSVIRDGRLAAGHDAELIVLAGDLARDLTGLRQVVLSGQSVGGSTSSTLAPEASLVSSGPRRPGDRRGRR